MTAAVLLLCACEIELTVVAVAFGLRFRAVPAAGITGAVAVAFALAIYVLWVIWFVAPGCIVNSVCAVQASSWPNVAAGAAAQWTGLLAAALAARFAKSRNLAHVSG